MWLKDLPHLPNTYLYDKHKKGVHFFHNISIDLLTHNKKKDLTTNNFHSIEANEQYHTICFYFTIRNICARDTI